MHRDNRTDDPIAFDPAPRRQTVRGLVLSEITCIANQRLESCRFDHPTLCLVIDGAYSEQGGPDSDSCGALTMLLRPPGIVENRIAGPLGARIFEIEFTQGILATHHIDPTPLVRTRLAADHAALPVLQRICTESDHAAALADGLIEGLALELLAVLGAQRPDAKVTWLDRLRGMLHQGFVDQFDHRVLARECGVHPVHMVRSFRTRHGCTIGEYLRALRVNHARTLMRTTKLEIREIAQRSGFADQAHMTRLFKRTLGFTPATLRHNP